MVRTIFASREPHIRRESIPLPLFILLPDRHNHLLRSSLQALSPLEIFPLFLSISRGKCLELQVQFVLGLLWLCRQRCWVPAFPTGAKCCTLQLQAKNQCQWWEICTHHSQICNYLSPECTQTINFPPGQIVHKLVTSERQGSTPLSPCWTFPVSFLPSFRIIPCYSFLSLTARVSIHEKMGSHHFILCWCYP